MQQYHSLLKYIYPSQVNCLLYVFLIHRHVIGVDALFAATTEATRRLLLANKSFRLVPIVAMLVQMTDSPLGDDAARGAPLIVRPGSSKETGGYGAHDHSRHKISIHAKFPRHKITPKNQQFYLSIFHVSPSTKHAHDITFN